MNRTILWMWLCINVNLKRAKQVLLLKKLKSIENIYDAGLSEYAECDFLSSDEINKLLIKNLDGLEEKYNSLSTYGVHTLTIDEPNYPDILREISDPPTLIYWSGKFVDLNERLCIAVVGTRKATEYGKKVAFNLSKELASKGAIIVSGMALGIDTRAHEGALSAGAPTVAVVGCGLDTAYPKSNTNLMNRIKETGMVISEYPIGTPVEKYHFPERNRIISGMSQGVLVVEADIKSGSLITAKGAYEQGRDVFAVPGNLNSPYSRGTNYLLHDGAHFVLSADDVINEYSINYADKLTNGINHTRCEIVKDAAEFSYSGEAKMPDEKILSVLKEGRMHTDEICQRAGLDIGCVNSTLLIMELKGLVIKNPGGYYELNIQRY